jgi:hypothetical protein
MKIRATSPTAFENGFEEKKKEKNRKRRRERLMKIYKINVEKTALKFCIQL